MSTCVNCGALRVDKTVRSPSSKPPSWTREPSVRLDRLITLVTVRLPVIFLTPSMERDSWPSGPAGTEKLDGIETEPLYVVQEAKAEASAVPVTVRVPEVLH